MSELIGIEENFLLKELCEGQIATGDETERVRKTQNILTFEAV